MIELVEEGVGTLMTMTQTYPSQAVHDQTLNFMETQPDASGADGYDRLAEMVEERESDSGGCGGPPAPSAAHDQHSSNREGRRPRGHDGRPAVGAARVLERHGVWPAGAPFVRYHTFPDIGPDTEGVGDLETDVEEGIPVAEALPGEGRIASGRVAGWPRRYHRVHRDAGGPRCGVCAHWCLAAGARGGAGGPGLGGLLFR